MADLGRRGPDSGNPFDASIKPANGCAFTTSSGRYPLANSSGAVLGFIPPNANGPSKRKTLFTFINDPSNEAQPRSSLFGLNGAPSNVTTGYGTAGSVGAVFRVKP